MLFMVQRESKTVADYRRLPEGAPMQLIDGEFIMAPAPRIPHQDISMQLSTLLNNFAQRHNLGKVLAAPVDVYLTPADVYQPDLLFIAREHYDVIRDDGVHGAPDLVVEILSASTAYYDEHRKKDIYESAGVKEYWLVDPMEASIEIFLNTGSEYTRQFKGKGGDACSSVLDGFCVDVPKLFARG